MADANGQNGAPVPTYEEAVEARKRFVESGSSADLDIYKRGEHLVKEGERAKKADAALQRFRASGRRSDLQAHKALSEPAAGAEGQPWRMDLDRADTAPTEDTAPEVAGSAFADAEQELDPYEKALQRIDALEKKIEGSEERQAGDLEGYAEKLQGQADEVAAVQNEAAARADRRTRAMELMSQRHDDAVAEAGHELRNAERMVTSHEIDPNRAFKTTGARVGSAIAIAMSALGQGMSGRAGPNTAYKIINDAINRDIDLQKEELRTRKDVLLNKNNLFANMMSRFGNERAAEIATHQAGLAAAKQKIEALQVTHKGQNAQAVISGMLGKIEADAIENGVKLAGLAGNLAVRGPGSARSAASGNDGTISSALAKLDLLPETFKKVGPIEGAIATTLSGFGLGGLIALVPGIRDADFYEDARNLIAKEITRAFDGGRPTDKDFAILLARLPPAGMEKEGGLNKIANLRAFLVAESDANGRFNRGALATKYGKEYDSLTEEQKEAGREVSALSIDKQWESFTPEGGKKKRPRIVKHEGRVSDKDLTSPVSGSKVSSSYGMRTHPIEKVKKMHKGVDFAAPKNTPVVSMFDGTVTYAGNQGGKTGYVVKIKDASGRETKFFHLNPGSLKVKKGQKVKAGQSVAGVGKSGGATGYHLHAELLVGGKHVDLADYLGET